MKGKYFWNSSFWDCRAKDGDSWLWKSWLSARGSLKLGARMEVGDGTTIKVWYSPWIPNNTSFKPRCCFWGDKGRIKWDKELILQTFDPVDAANIIKIPIATHRKKDKWIWNGGKEGEFSTKAVYHTIRESRKIQASHASSSKPGSWWKNMWNVLWHLNIKPKVKQFIWRCWFVETLEHLLFYCHKTLKCWKISGVEWNLLKQKTMNFQRNKWVFKGDWIHEIEVVAKAKVEWMEWDNKQAHEVNDPNADELFEGVGKPWVAVSAHSSAQGDIVVDCVVKHGVCYLNNAAAVQMLQERNANGVAFNQLIQQILSLATCCSIEQFMLL
ncbi:ribonuclease H-like superfamily protein [Striga asiatica]|uniref:Ribonuclease H-like superfamily protein n=1 Tax=Striga asiatica TaxID=4170 RepID=A0A5A7QGQ9_STRAF|nr:ribonuclease H-like superfamily protein [Striga asiatica]